MVSIAFNLKTVYGNLFGLNDMTNVLLNELRKKPSNKNIVKIIEVILKHLHFLKC